MPGAPASAAKRFEPGRVHQRHNAFADDEEDEAEEEVHISCWVLMEQLPVDMLHAHPVVSQPPFPCIPIHANELHGTAVLYETNPSIVQHKHGVAVTYSRLAGV